MISSNVVCRELIGRSGELAHLAARLRPGAGRSSALVVVRGEAGVGKTRLAQEFAAAAERHGARVAICGAREYASAPYAPVVEAIEALGGRVTFAESELGGEAGADDKTRRFTAVAAVFSSLVKSSDGGIAVVVEDLQWADGGTIDALRFLARRLAGERIVFVATYRSDEIEADSTRARTLAALERDAGETIGLEPLRADEIERLLRSMVRDAETPVRPAHLAEIRELADGRPLFAEELLRGVFERIARDGDARAVVPTSIRATVRERFGELSAAERNVLLHAAVIGKRFSARFLSRLTSVEPADVFRALRRARDQQLIVEEHDDDGDCFSFRHALLREAVYGELLRAEVRVLHAHVAAELIREPEIDVAAVAEHAYRARDAEPALMWNERAGDQAVSLYAYADAARHYERAHEFAGSEARSAQLARKCADALYAAGALEQAAAWLARALSDSRAAGDTGGALQLATQRARILWEAGRRDEGIDELRALAVAVPDDAPALRFEAATVLASLLNASGRPADALEQLTVARPLIGHGDEHLVTRFHGISGYTLALLGRPAEAREPFAAAIERARRLGDDDVLLRTLNNYGNVELSAGTAAAARALYEDALTVAERTKNLRVIAWVSQNAAVAALVGGDLETAARHVQRSQSIEHDVPLVHRFRSALTLRLRTLLGDPRERERREAESACAEALRDGDQQAICVLAAALGHDMLAEGRDAELHEILRTALGVLTRADAPYWLIGLAARAGEPAERLHARRLAELTPAHGAAHGPRALLLLCDAREALRKRRRDVAEALASQAAAAFRAAGWVLDEAEALEAAGRVAEAVAILRRIGAANEVRRLTQTATAVPRRRGEATLTAREREIANLLTAGRTAREIADALVISERTVETHVAAVYRKLGVSSRQELTELLRESAAAPSVRSGSAEVPYRPG